MPDIHLKRFHGQNVDLIVESKSKFDNFIYFHFTNKLAKESKNLEIKYSLEEIAMILCILRKDLFIWKSYRGEDLEVTYAWQDNDTNQLWIHAGNYSKTLNIGQIEVLKLLILHLLKEKVKFATSKNIINTDDDDIKIPPDGDKNFNIESIETISKIEGRVINETDKAVLINFRDKTEVWIPKSAIHSPFSTAIASSQLFLIENWVLKKNDLDHLISNSCTQK